LALALALNFRFRRGEYGEMLFFWVILFVATFLGSIALVFYLTLELNEMEKKMTEMSKIIRKRYGDDGEKDKKHHAKK
jgi:hypothetical protein